MSLSVLQTLIIRTERPYGKWKKPGFKQTIARKRLAGHTVSPKLDFNTFIWVIQRAGPKTWEVTAARCSVSIDQAQGPALWLWA